MNYKSYGDLSEDIAASLFLVQGKGYDLVVGIPRSGMIPASMVALGLHIDVVGLPEFIANQPLKTRMHRKAESQPSVAWDAKKVLLIDDSVITGRTVQEARDAIPDNCPCTIDTLVIYADPDGKHHVDISFCILESPRAFQWNLFTPAMLSRACVDIDGVLCVDPTAHQNDDGEKYVAFLNNAEPLFLPSGRIGCLVTNRLEKYRRQTEAWLKQQGIEYERLVMLDLPSKEERQRQGVHSTHKGLFYKNVDYTFFIESDTKQAASIAKISGKAVYCCEDNRVYMPTDKAPIKKDRRGYAKRLLRSVKRRIVSGLPRPPKAALKAK
ncbi:phosphoribosyltransferase family protein [Vreelandella rituensis]|uniref:Phosphoribosyltransferase n=1 Tax=Vreelandella rituensis TaxID=2282306 RepID=A0A368TQR2_9GAMM|nr:phosphoribosyltransferase family protein [Halomonas rituensis]RCV86656.1 phosphoribosyltransferase [Halomonas rituensis]